MVNAFDSGNGRSELPELFHSEFLGAALRISLKEGNRRLFDGVWNLCTPDADDWKPPTHARVVTEQRVNNGDRVDICLLDGKSLGRVVGIEVKSKRASAEFGQLGRYLTGLQLEFPDACVELAYLTPFNSEHAGEHASRLRTVQVFDDFVRKGGQGRHVSWRDIAKIKWDGGAFWSEHQSYVLNNMASADKLQNALSQNRSFDEFFGEDATDTFLSVLPVSRAEGTDDPVRVDLEELGGRVTELVEALKVLIEEGDNVVKPKRANRFPASRREHFESSDYGAFHEALFCLSDQYEYVWVQGEQNYGLRVAHKNHPGGVSLLTSRDERHLIIGQRR